MPELPDIELYLHALRPRVVGKVLDRVLIASPFVLRTFDPPIEETFGKPILGLGRIGKRIVFEFPDELYIVVHLMIAGRWKWSERPNVKPPGKKTGLACFYLSDASHAATGVADQAGQSAPSVAASGGKSLLLIEPSQQKRASIHVVQGEQNLRAMDPGGMNLLTGTLEEFARRLRSENHTLKRSLTSPRLFDGIGNAYSDEILWAAKLSPVKLTSRLHDLEIKRLFDATRATLLKWIDILREDFRDAFPGPGDITAFRPDFAVHGRFGQPCRECETIIQRIRYAENETNYCPRCQTDGKMLADRSLSRLLKDDWPKTVEEWEKA